MTEIVYITNVRLPTYRAHGLQIMKMCEAFARAGVRVRLIAPNLKPSVQENPFKYYDVARTFSLHWVPVLEVVPLERWLGRWVGYVQNVSFSFCAMAYLFMRGWFRDDGIFYTRDYTTALFLSMLGRRPAFELHDYRSLRPHWRIGFILRRSRLVVVNSEGTLQALQAHYRIDKKRVLVAPNGVDLAFFDIPQSRDEARDALGIPRSAAVISYIGSLEAAGLQKGINTLLQAFVPVSRAHPEAILLIVGGPEHAISRYQRVAHELGISGARVRFVEQVAYRDVPQYMCATDIAVIPLPAGQYGQTTSPIKLFEYMAAGKVIVASDLPSLREYLNNGNADFFKPSDAEDLAKHLHALLVDPAHAHSLAEAALRDSAHHTWESRARHILGCLRQR